MLAPKVAETLIKSLAPGEPSIDAVGVFRDSQAPADFADRLSLTKLGLGLGLARPRDYLPGRSSLRCHVRVSHQELGNSRIQNPSPGSDLERRPIGLFSFMAKSVMETLSEIVAISQGCHIL